jgi:hypothetical protein
MGAPMDLRDRSDLDRRAMEIWRAREDTFPDRVRRLTPDHIDFATGTWEVCVAQAATELGISRKRTAEPT